MIETFLFIISGTTVTMRGFNIEPDVVVPSHIVRYCGVLNNVDPYDGRMSNTTELKLYDCYSATMGYYDEPLNIKNTEVYRLFD